MYNQVFFEVHDLKPVLHTLVITFMGEVNQIPLIMQSFRIENVPPSLAPTSLPASSPSSSPTSSPSSSSVPPPASPHVRAGVVAGAVVAAIVALLFLLAFILYKYRHRHLRKINEEADTTAQNAQNVIVSRQLIANETADQSHHTRSYSLFSPPSSISSPWTADSKSPPTLESVSGQSVVTSSPPRMSVAARPLRDMDSGWRSNPGPIQESAVVLPPVYTER